MVQFVNLNRELQTSSTANVHKDTKEKTVKMTSMNVKILIQRIFAEMEFVSIYQVITKLCQFFIHSETLIFDELEFNYVFLQVLTSATVNQVTQGKIALLT
jgi:hypothetical protein